MKDATLIIAIIDKSGSMEGAKKKSTIDGFNSFLHEQKGVPGEASLSIVMFSHEYERGGTGPLHDVEPLTEESYSTGGSTALLDAIGRTIDGVGAELADLEELERPSRVVFLIMTDGQENASTEYERARIRGMITHQEDVYNWDFLFIGAGLEAFAQASSIGIKGHKMQQVSNDADGVSQGYASISEAVGSKRRAAPDVEASFYEG